jgi:hypothetical protein
MKKLDLFNCRRWFVIDRVVFDRIVLCLMVVILAVILIVAGWFVWSIPTGTGGHDHGCDSGVVSDCDDVVPVLMLMNSVQ